MRHINIMKLLDFSYLFNILMSCIQFNKNIVVYERKNK